MRACVLASSGSCGRATAGEGGQSGSTHFCVPFTHAPLPPHLRAGIGYDYAMNAIWDFKNKGVRTRRRLHIARPTLRCAAPGRASPLPPPTPLPFAEALEGHQDELQGGVERAGCYWGLTVAALVADVALRELEV